VSFLGVQRRIMQWLHRPGGPAWRARKARMEQFAAVMRPERGARILDLGGTAALWGMLDVECDVTLVNLPGTGDRNWQPSRWSVRCVEADACDLSGVFEDRSFDIVFSNSVIEHVGDHERQQRMAAEVARLAPRYWVQTPSDRFPIEAHTLVPFYFRLPSRLRGALLRGMRRRSERFAEMIQETRVLSRDRMRALFPDGEILLERRLGLEKSIIACRPG